MVGIGSQDQEQWRSNLANVLSGSLYGESRTARHNQAVNLDHGQVGGDEDSVGADQESLRDLGGELR